MPKKWKCPHCGRENKTSIYADECLLENFKYLEHCWCGYVHCWELKLTEEFKKNLEKKTQRDKERHINNVKLK
jgi:hypothetical protein